MAGPVSRISNSRTMVAPSSSLVSAEGEVPLAPSSVTPPPSPPNKPASSSSRKSKRAVATATVATSNGNNKNSRRKVLCLGMSYPSLTKQLLNYNVDPTTWLEGRSAEEVTVEDVFQCVNDGMLTEMDARDLARCVATEIASNVNVYTVSQEKAALYDDNRHLDANFNRHRFVHSLHFLFGRDAQGNPQKVNPDDRYQDRKFHPEYSVRFRQAILDYFWIPQGWDQNHWSPSLFTDILPALVHRGVLDMDMDADDNDDDNNNNDINTSVPCGVYLPFCFHVFRQVINALPLLQQYYAISFLRKNDLHEISLWKGTQTIDERRMASLLGKRRDQEEVYCTFGSQEVMEAGEGPRDEPKDILMEILQRLEDFDDIRMIKLRPLKQHNQLLTKKLAKSLHEKGGLKGLVDPRTVKRGFKVESVQSGIASESETDDVSTVSDKKNKKKRAPPTTPRAASKTAKRKRAVVSVTSSTTKKRRQSPPAALNAVKKRQAKRSLHFSSTSSTCSVSMSTRSSRSKSSSLGTTARTSGRNNVELLELPSVTRKASTPKVSVVTPSLSSASSKHHPRVGASNPTNNDDTARRGLDLSDEQSNSPSSSVSEKKANLGSNIVKPAEETTTGVDQSLHPKRQAPPAAKRPGNRMVTKSKPLSPRGKVVPSAASAMRVVPNDSVVRSLKPNSMRGVSPVSVLERFSGGAKSLAPGKKSRATVTNKSMSRTEPAPSESEQSGEFMHEDDEDANVDKKRAAEDLASSANSESEDSDITEEGPEPALTCKARLDEIDELLRRTRQGTNNKSPKGVQAKPHPAIDIREQLDSSGDIQFQDVQQGDSSRAATALEESNNGNNNGSARVSVMEGKPTTPQKSTKYQQRGKVLTSAKRSSSKKRERGGATPSILESPDLRSPTTDNAGTEDSDYYDGSN